MPIRSPQRRSASHWALVAWLLGACLNPQPDPLPMNSDSEGNPGAVVDVRPETCDDNPLLAGCGSAAPGNGPAASPSAGQGGGAGSGSAGAGGGAGSGGSNMGSDENPADAGPPEAGPEDADAP